MKKLVKNFIIIILIFLVISGVFALVSEPFDEWMRDLRVKIKDTELRYKTSLNKEEISITARDVKKLLNAEYDNLQKWNLQEKKVIIEKIGGGFLPIDQIVDNLKIFLYQFEYL